MKTNEYYEGYNDAIEQIVVHMNNKIQQYISTNQPEKVNSISLMIDDVEMMRK